MRMSGNLLNGITPRERRVTNADAANPRPTLENGQPTHQWRVGLGSRRSVIIRALERPAVSQVPNRDHIAWAARERFPKLCSDR